MIFELKIKDFILIDSETITFKDGLNIITGETGAGKSMILGAINLVLGAAANKEAIRIGAERALVQCSFYANEPSNRILREAGIDTDEDFITISREINVKGKSISRINGQTTTLNVIKSVTAFLLDIHGQYDNQVVFDKGYQLSSIDSYGGSQLLNKRHDLSVVYDALHKKVMERKAFLSDLEEREKQTDFLTFQADEIDQIGPKIGEDEAIETAFDYHANLEKISEAFENAKIAFEGEFGDGILSVLSKVSSAFKKIEAYDEKARTFSSRIEEQFYLLEDLSRDLNHHSDNLTQDPEKLHQLETRLNDLNKLKSKYGKTIEAILSYRADIQEKLEHYEGVEQELSACELEILKLEEQYDFIADELTTLRVKAADRFVTNVTKELTSLNMHAAVVSYNMDRLEKRTTLGIDDFELVIATNVGQPLKPLKKVLSGGELSRLMLSIKIVSGDEGGDISQIFDEIDAGISGITANVVGEKLHALAGDNQIICITHLPQIAVFADHHFRIQKSLDTDRAITEITEISKDEIVNEISRLVGGAEVTSKTQDHVDEMLRQASLRKKEHGK